MVYFIKCEQYIKVGYTSNMKNRMKAYVTENPFPCKVLHVIKGGLTIEKNIHKLLEKYKHRGEWFNICDESIRIIGEVVRNSQDNIEPKKIKRRRKKK